MSAGLDFWKTRNARDAAHYWHERGAGYRALLASMLHQVAPFESLLEIGCHSGPNLWAIRQQFPAPHLMGLEPSEPCAAFGLAACTKDAIARMTADAKRAYEARVPEEGEMPSVGIDFFVGCAPDGLQDFKDIDVVLTCYTLAYLPLDACAETLRRACELAKKAIVLAEPMHDSGQPEALIRSGDLPTWRRNYADWFRTSRPDWAVVERPFPAVQDLNRVVIARAPRASTHG